MKKKIVLATCLLMTVLFALSACGRPTIEEINNQLSSSIELAKREAGSSDTVNKGVATVAPDNGTDIEKQASLKDTSKSDSFDANAIAKALVVKGETLRNDYSNYLILILTNNSQTDCDCTIDVDLYDSNNKIVGTETEEVKAFAKGTTIAVSFSCNEVFAKYEYTVEPHKLSLYHCVDQNLSCEVSTAKDKAIVMATNSGTVPAQFVQYEALFYKGGQLVSRNWGYITDNDSEIKPGKTLKEECSCYEDFDSVNVFIHGQSEADFNMN